MYTQSKIKHRIKFFIYFFIFDPQPVRDYCWANKKESKKKM